MTKREYLQQPYKLRRRIELGMEQIELIRTLAENGRAPSSEDGGGGCGGSGMSRSFVENQTVHYISLQDEVNANLEKYQETAAVIRRAIHELDSTELEFVLESRYLIFKDWQDIADDLRVSLSYVFQLHRKAVKRIKFDLKDTCAVNSSK